MSLQPIGAQPLREYQDSRFQVCRVRLKQLVEKVVSYITQFFQVFYIFGYMYYLHRREGRSYPELWNPIQPDNMPRLFRRWLQHPVEAITVQQGIDARLNPNHLQASIGEQLAVPDAPDIDVNVLNELFDQLINVNDPENPNYVDPATLRDDPDAPATYAQLKKGLRDFLVFIMVERPNYSRDLSKMLKHITHELVQGNHPDALRRECILDLARAGCRHCPTLMNGRTRVWYGILKGQAHEKDYSQTVMTVLHDFRDRTLYKMAKQDVHAYQEYLASIGQLLGVKLASSADNDDPTLMIKADPRYSLPVFFREYTPETIAREATLALNGIARDPTRPWERTGRKIPFERTTDWLREAVGEEDMIHYLDGNTLTQEGVAFVLERLGVFVQPE